MKNLFKSLMVFAIAITLPSCSNDDNNSQPKTIAEIAKFSNKEA